jgi:hypothetical protein
MRVLKHSFFLIAIFAFLFSACKKEDSNNNNNDNNNTKNRCDVITCFNGGTCSEEACQCPTEWTGEFCDTSAILTPYFNSYRINTNGGCVFENLAIQFMPRENETNPLVCDLIISIGCNFGRDKVVKFYTVFDGENFTTNTVNCVYNNIVDASYNGNGYFTSDSVFFTLNSSFRTAPSETCTYSGPRQ